MLNNITDFWSGLSFTKNINKMRKALMDFFATEGITCEIKDGALLFEYKDSWYIVNFAIGDDYAECGIIYYVEEKTFEAMELSDKTFIAAKVNNEIDNHAIMYVYNDSFKISSTFYFTSKRMLMELFTKHFNELTDTIAGAVGLIREHLAEEAEEEERENTPQQIGFCVQPEEDDKNENAQVAKKL